MLPLRRPLLAAGLTAALVALLAGSSPAAAQAEVQLAADINPGASGSTPSYLAVYDGVLYFQADDGTNGSELWRYTNGAAALVDDIREGAASSVPAHFTDYAGALYFMAADDATGGELYRYEPGAGTELVADVLPGPAGSGIEELTVFDDALYFRAIGELWRYRNGSAELAADIRPSAHSFPEALTVYDGALYFQAIGPNANDTEVDGLYRYTEASGAERVEDVAFPQFPTFATYDGALYFAATTASDLAPGADGVGYELYRYTEANGLELAADIDAGAESSTPRHFAIYDGALYFSAESQATGYELWRYTTADGAVLAADVNPGSAGSGPRELVVFDGALYFQALDSAAGRELHRYTPTEGASLVADVYPGSASSYFYGLTVYDGALFFQAEDGTAGAELYRYGSSMAEPDIYVTPDAVDLGEIASGSPTPWLFVVHNVGDAPLVVTDATSSNGALALDPSAPAFPVTVSALSDVTFDFAVNASLLAPGVYTETFAITSDDPDEGTVELPVTFTVVPHDGSCTITGFDTGDEGWEVQVWQGHPSGFENLPAGYSPYGGDPGGHLARQLGPVASTQSWFWQAPASTLTALSGAYGGALHFGLRAVGSGGYEDFDLGGALSPDPSFSLTGDVFIGVGDGEVSVPEGFLSVLAYDVPDTQGVYWQTYGVPLTADGWQAVTYSSDGQFTVRPPTEAEFQAALAAFDSGANTLLLPGSHFAMTTESMLDNVSIGAGCGPVPLAAVPAVGRVLAGDEFDVEVVAGSPTAPVPPPGLFGVGFELSFDPDRFEFVSAAPGDWLDDGDLLTSTPQQPAPGTVAYSVSRNGAQTSGGALGHGPVAVLRFRVKEGAPEGAATFTPGDVLAVGPDGVALALQPVSGEVEVVDLLVWPGDLNADGVVDVSDPNLLGTYFGSTGPPRPGASFVWSPQPAEAWDYAGTDPAPPTGFDLAHVDATGDGEIDQNDLLPVGLNYGCTHSGGVGTCPGGDAGPATPHNARRTEPLATLTIEPLAVGDTLTVTLALGANGAGFDGLLGVAASLLLPPELAVTAFAPGPWLDDGDVLAFDAFDEQPRRFDVAVTRKGTNAPVQGAGTALAFTLEVVGEMAGPVELALTFAEANYASGTVEALPAEAVELREAVATGAEDGAAPAAFALEPAYPNPFAARATIPYALAEPCPVRLEVYDVLGRRVAVLVDEEQPAGRYEAAFEAGALAAGTYVVRLAAGAFSAAERLTVVR